MCGYHQTVSNNQWLLRSAKLGRMIFEERRRRSLSTADASRPAWHFRADVFLIKKKEKKKPIFLFFLLRSLRSRFYLFRFIFRRIPSSYFRVTRSRYFVSGKSCNTIFIFCYCLLIDRVRSDIFLFLYSSTDVCNLSSVIGCVYGKSKLKI